MCALSVAADAGLLAGVIGGVVTAVAIPFVLPPMDSSAHDGMKSLSGRERREVMRSVRRGELVRDPRLAKAAVLYAQYLQRHDHWATSTRQRVLSGFTLVFWTLLAGAAVASGNYGGAILPATFSWSAPGPPGLNRSQAGARRKRSG